MHCRHSLRFRLLKIIAIPLMVSLIAIDISAYLSAKHEAEEIYDAQLAHFARVLGLLTQHEIDEGDLTEKLILLQEGKFNTPYEKDLAYRVWLDDNILLQSDNAMPFGPLTQSSGFTDRAIGHQLWRLFILREGNVTIEVAEDYHARNDLTEKVALSILLPLLLIFPALIITIWYGVRFGVAPLEKISNAIQQQKPEALKPIEDKAVPDEVKPLIEALNRLMQRVEEVIAREKRFTGYAAHELRTPLAALKTQVQVALRCKDLQEQQTMFGEVVPGIDRMAHLVEQLLTLVRAQHSEGESEKTQINFSALLQGTIADFVNIALQKNQHITSHITDNIHIIGNADMLHVLLRNILDNAIRYSPENADIDISLQLQENQLAVLAVSNSGVTLSDKQISHLFDPFYRGADNKTQGAGLGLAIVNWIAKQHHAVLSCSSSNNKTTIQLQLPLQ